MVEIDGASGEGGGQVLRTALALSMITGQPLQIRHIRAKRPKPGLMRQHLTCVHAAAAISGAAVTGAQLGSSQLEFAPQAVRPGEYRFAMETAGSCTLVLQTIWPALMLADAPSRIHLSGGTHNPMAPCFHFVQRSYAPLLAKLGAASTLALQRMGFAPAGGGVIEALIEPASVPLTPLDLVTRGTSLGGYAESYAPGLARNIAHRELQQLGQMLGWSYEKKQLRIGPCKQHEGPGNALLVTLEYANTTQVMSRLGQKNTSAEQVANQLAKAVRRFQMREEAVLDEYLADQWALPLALAVSRSGQAAQFTCTDISLHASTNFSVIEQFLPVRFMYEQCTGKHHAYWLVRCAPCDAPLTPSGRG
ncbi:RNA 3'-terminal phosphate cyclase [Lampropedia aestuarii]|uniref:RNA 3'-terminal phosphate cyclase n=1 Tax=Lampropedia aestuarii TaxID=2562762 RepID=UPI002469AE49|nr:RNA 3'-terminal phosphate cyclase [Lampropedia aestuarii]MDH5856201.1 RNA 3'-terminal phosphate cyclase [Lampropedia aestuarii]